MDSRRGQCIDAALIQGDSWDLASVDSAVERLWRGPDRPTAIFGANDNLAFRALGVLHLAGARVPEDVALIGFDDIPLANEMVPSLTTVRIPLLEIGRRASRLVLEQLAAPERGPARTEVIVPELVRRATA